MCGRKKALKVIKIRCKHCGTLNSVIKNLGHETRCNQCNHILTRAEIARASQSKKNESLVQCPACGGKGYYHIKKGDGQLFVKSCKYCTDGLVTSKYKRSLTKGISDLRELKT